MAETIHWSDWAQQPKIRIFCTQEHHHPWPIPYLPDNVHSVPESADHPLILYSFDARSVTCPECKRSELFQKELDRVREFYENLKEDKI